MSLELLSLIWLVSVILVIKLAPSIVGGFGPEAPAKDFEDLAALLFGATSIAIVILSVVISLAAVVGWSHLRQSIREDVEKVSRDRDSALKAQWDELSSDLKTRTDDSNKTSREEVSALVTEVRAALTAMQSDVANFRGELDRLNQEMIGRTLVIFGNMWGRLGLKPDEPVRDEGREEFLVDAVSVCNEALKALGANAESPAHYLALNNLVFYESIYRSSDPKPIPGQVHHSKSWLLAKARVLLTVAQKHADGSSRTVPLLLTYCCTVNLFSRDPEEQKDALGVAVEVASRDDTSYAQQREANFYKSRLEQKLRLAEEN